MSSPQTEDVRQGISVIWENLQCPICLELLDMPVSTSCGHQFCRFCMMKLLDRSRRKEAKCPVCTMKVTKRTLQENPGFQRLVEGLKYLVQSYEFDTCTNYFSRTQRKQQNSSENRNLHDREENKHSSELEKPLHNLSLSSSAAAKEGFAQLMDFENSFPITSEEEEVDISELPPMWDNDIILPEKRKEPQGPRLSDKSSKDELEVYLPRKGSMHQLEEKVFGVVYKRDRKTNRHSPNTELPLETEKRKKETTGINNNEAFKQQMDVEEPKELAKSKAQEKTVDLKIGMSGQLEVTCEVEHEKSDAIVCAVEIAKEMESDNSDSEQNTEQLRTLKKTKRKSFCLDSPNATLSSFKNGVDSTDNTKKLKNAKNDSPSKNILQPMLSKQSQLKNSRCFGNAGSTSVKQLSKTAYCGHSPVHTSLLNSEFTDNSEAVDSVLLFPVSNAKDGEPQNQSKATEEKHCSEMTQSHTNTSENPSKHQGHVAQSASLGNFCHSSGNIVNSCPQSLESSITPDGLMVDDPVPVKKNNTKCVSLPKKMKRKRRAQRLYSSDSDLSSGEDGLPSLLKYHPLDHQSSKKTLAGSVILNKTGLQFDKRKNKGLGTSSQSSSSLDQPESWSGCQGKVSTQGHNGDTETPATLQDGNVSVLHKDDCLSQSQGSVDLFGTQDEFAVDGLSGDVKLSVDSFQYEVINTQQKVEMQEELLRLERMMVLVSEALSKKSDCCAKPGNTSNSHQTLLGQHSGTECVEEVWKRKQIERDCSDDSEAVQLKAVRSKVQTKKGVKGSLRYSQAQMPADWHEEKGVQREASPAHMKIMGGIGSSCGVAGLVASGLSANEMSMVKKFARKIGCSLTKQMTPSTTHIIIKTDRFMVCERTLKYFQGIAGRKWVVSFQWIYESFKQGKVLDEVPFEVCGDVVNGHSHNGPLKARKTSDDNLLLKGYEICFHGPFTYMNKGQMEMMVKMCGASVVTDPLMFSSQGTCQLVVVQPNSAGDYEFYKALQQKATVVSRSWLLDSIATYTLQSPEHYRP